ncbi:MAG TPA: hypothetical protein VLD67_19785 [Vicinamibacterales bacterium]|nr:hypothetical protein [Vicinamibacterales bacterium]
MTPAVSNMSSRSFETRFRGEIWPQVARPRRFDVLVPEGRSPYEECPGRCRLEFEQAIGLLNRGVEPASEEQQRA